MPKLKVKDLEMYYEIHGGGSQTLVMIRGLGSDLTCWYEQTPVFARHFRVLIFDNRGAGRTEKPDAPYSMRQMADDTAGLMNALDIRRAALLGVSMGGMIAREFALNHGSMLSCLILGCTTFGGPRTISASPEIIATLNTQVDRNSAESLKASFCDETIARRPDVIKKDREARLTYPASPESYARQIGAAMAHDTSARHGSIKIPTMVMTGTGDRLVPPENARLIAKSISGATLKELPGGHVFFVEYPELFNQAVIDFVKAHP
jgi:pimeloyl-ACP methyl ester carboxylesterase